MPSEPDRFRLFFAQFLHFYSQSCAVVCSIARTRRPVRAFLAKGQIVAYDLNTSLHEGIRHSYQQRRVAVGTGTVSENQAIRQNEPKMRKGRPARQPFD